MSHRSRSTTRKHVNPASTRRDMLTAAIMPLLEMLEHRNLFSAAPTADPGGPYLINEGQSILIDGRNSSDSDGTVVTYQWDTNYNPAKGFRQRFTGPTWNFTADTSGSRTIALRVVDNDGDVSDIQTTTINIADVLPTLTLNSPSTGLEGSPVTVSWSYTDPGIEDVVTEWTIDWGDDSAPTVVAGDVTQASHIYAEDGNYVIELTSKQAEGTTSVTSNIVITHVTPIVQATTPTPVIDEGEMAQIDFTCLNRLNSIEGYQIDWGDGFIDVMGPNRSHAAHFYTDSGVYTVTTSAQEPDGGLGSTTVTIVVNNVAPEATINGVPASSAEGQAINLSSTVTDAGVDDTHVYGWTVYKDGEHFILPGGTTLDDTTFTFVPTDNGTYQVRLTVIDDEGGEVSVLSDPIVVNNVAPTAVINGTPVGNVNEGSAVNLSVTAGDDSEVDAAAGFAYEWSVTKDGAAYALGDGVVSDAANFSFVPRDNGVYVVSVKVTDKDGGHVTVSSAAINVDNVAPAPGVNDAPANSTEGSTITVSASENDAGADDTHTYNWSVQKRVTGTPGSVTFGSEGLGEMLTLDWGNSTTVVARLSLSSEHTGYGQLLFQYDGSLYINFRKTGGIYSVSVEDFQDIVIAQIQPDQMFDLAISYDGDTGVTRIFIDGEKAAEGVLTAGHGGEHHTHFADTVPMTVEHLAIYQSVLSDSDILDLHDGKEIVPEAHETWAFNETGGLVAYSEKNTPIHLSVATFSGSVSTWEPYALPAELDTTSKTFSFVPVDNGSYRVVLTVTDDDGADATVFSNTINVANVAPTAEISGPSEGEEGAALNFSVAVTDVGTADTHTYSWSVTKDGEPVDLTGIDTTSATFTFTPDDNGEYVVSVTVTDKDGGATTVYTGAINVANVPPTATIVGAPETSPEGTIINLTSVANDVDADVLTYAWSVTRDGEPVDLTGVTTDDADFEFTPADDGTYVFTLTVTDKDGGQATDSKTVVVGNVAPTASISGEPVDPINEGDEVELTATATDPGDDTISYAWTIKKDGQLWTPPEGTVLNNPVLVFTPTDNGTYVATVTVSDEDGGETSTDSQPIAVANVAPTAAINGAPAGGDEGTAITVGSTVTDVGTADTHTYSWSVTKDGEPVDLTGIDTTSATFTFTPADNGMYEITLTVTDDDGDADTTNTSFVIDNVAPAPVITADGDAYEGQAITLHAAHGDPGSADTHTYSWSVTKDGQPVDLTGIDTTSATFTFTPAIHGQYVIAVTVTDDDDAQETATHTLTVHSVAPTVLITGVPDGPRGEGTPLSFGSTVTDVPAESDFTYLWSVTRDGQAFALPNDVVVDGATFEFTPTDNGVYVVSLAVTDSAGETGIATTSDIIVTNTAPNAIILGAPEGPITEGTPVTLTLDAQDPGAEDTLTIQWSVTRDGQTFALPDGVAVDGTTFEFTPTDNGTYVVTVVVTDDDGASVTVNSTAILVNNVAPTAALTGVPADGHEGTAISVGSTVADAGAEDTHTYLWTVTRDGAAFNLPANVDQNSPTFSFVPTDNGTYVISLTVVDDDLASVTVDSDPIVVNNVSPGGTISGIAEVDEGTPVTVVASVIDAGAEDTHTYAWSITRDGDPVVLDGNVVTDAPSITYTPTDDGEYVFSVLITDKDGDTVMLTHTVTVHNAAPSVALVDVPATGSEGTAITVGSNVADPGDDTLTYGWTVWKNGEHFILPGGAEITGQSLTFTPTDEGNYVVRLTVVDDDGGITTVNSSPIVVAGVAPTATIIGDSEVAEDGMLSLDSTVTDPSTKDVDAGFTYAWTVKRGQTTVATGNAATFDFTPTVHGEYVVSLTVTDKDGLSTTTSTNVSVTNIAPSNAAIGGIPGAMVEGNSTVLTGSAVDAVGDELTYDWVIKRNGAVIAEFFDDPDITFAPAARGTYEVTLTVTDTAGVSTQATETIVVGNIAPAGTLTGPSSTVLLGNTATFGLSIDDVPPSQVMNVTWDFGDGQTATASYTGDQAGIIKAHTYANKGVYTVTVTINDGVDSTVLTRTVSVQPVAIVTDPADNTKTALVVLGTTGNDAITVNPIGGGKYGVTLNGVSHEPATAPTGKLYIYGNGGADAITVNGTIDSVVFAGADGAGSLIVTGGGNDVIVGSAGADRLYGGAGRDILIGAGGADSLAGGDSEDLIVAHGTTWMNDLGSILGLKAKWDAVNQNAAERRAAIKASGLFNANKLIADTVSDQIYGEAKADWFVLDTSTDRLRDYVSSQDLVN